MESFLILSAEVVCWGPLSCGDLDPHFNARNGAAWSGLYCSLNY